MAQFNQTTLMGDRVLVSGTDDHGTEGKVILDASEWNEVKRRNLIQSAGAEMDAKIEEFFAPLVRAAEKFDATGTTQRDPISYIVVQEAEEGRTKQHEVLHELSKDSIVLRILESDDHARLVWVGPDHLEVLSSDSVVSLEEAVENVEDVLGGEVIGEGNVDTDEGL